MFDDEEVKVVRDDGNGNFLVRWLDPANPFRDTPAFEDVVHESELEPIDRPISEEILLGCPFCDGANVALSGGFFSRFAVHCPDCGATGPAEIGKGHAVRRWNEARRPIRH